MICQHCLPWNLPLTLNVSVGQPAIKYEQWLWYRLHVQMHQKDNWAGEIDTVTKYLKEAPTFTLIPS